LLLGRRPLRVSSLVAPCHPTFSPKTGPHGIFSQALNTDFSTKGLSALEIQSIVAAWQSGAISRDTMTELFRRGEVLPEGRSMAEEERLIVADQRAVTASLANGKGK